MQGLVLSAAQIRAALPRVSDGLAKYTWLQLELRLRDVSSDTEYQRRFVGFYRVRRNAEWRGAFFRILEQAKDSPVSFGETLRALHAATGQVEASFASKLVATLDPSQPVIDKVVFTNLGLKLPNGINRIAEIQELHKRLGDLYSKYLASESGRSLVARFQHRYPGARVTEAKMLDFVLWQSRPKP